MAKMHYIRKYENEMTYKSFKILLLWTMLTIKESAELCGVTERTMKAWIKTNKPALSARRLMEWYYYGIPQIKNWNNWKIRNGYLTSPEGMKFNSKHLTMLPLLHGWYEKEKNKHKS